MAEFLTDSNLNTALEKIVDNASEQLILISPFIKLHDRIKDKLLNKKDEHNLKITVVFGKNEDDPHKSLSEADLSLFTQFPNIEIRFEPRLHAKYYANESQALITSMNLHSSSQNNNIEAGILVNASLLNLARNIVGGRTMDDDAFFYFEKVIQRARLVFHRVPEIDSTLGGLRKIYKGSTTKVDNLSETFSVKKAQVYHKPTPPSPVEVPVSQSANSGYCLRTGKPIPFNPKRPFCDEAYNSWTKFKNETYPEKYCHFSGEASNGDTSFCKPILKKNWQKAKMVHGI